MNTETHLSFKITNACDLKCAHCCENSSPKESNVLFPLEETHKRLSEWKSNSWLEKGRYVVLTGGEPTLAYQKDKTYLPKVIDAIYQAGFLPVLKTNGVWGKDNELRKQILNDLSKSAQKSGRTITLEISIDEFHDNIIPVRNIFIDLLYNKRSADSILLSLVGFGNQKSKDQLLNLMNEIHEFDGTEFKINNEKQEIYLYGEDASFKTYMSYSGEVDRRGRAEKNDLSKNVLQTNWTDCLMFSNEGINPGHGKPINFEGKKLDDLIREIRSGR